MYYAEFVVDYNQSWIFVNSMAKCLYFEREKYMADSNFSKLQLEFEEDSTT